MAQAVGGLELLAGLRQTREESDAVEFEEFFTSTFQRVVGMAAVVSGDPGLAEDAGQEAYFRALNRWDQIRKMDRPDLWVARVAINLVLDDRRKTRRREAPLNSEVEHAAHDQIESMWVRWNLGQLTPMQRAALVLRYVDGLPVADVAQSLGRSTATVKTHIRLGRQRLRQLLTGELFS